VRFLEGNLPDAQSRLDHVLSAPRQRDALADCGALAPLYALALVRADSEAGQAAAKRVLNAGTRSWRAVALRSLRILLVI